jgi:hypothetical protein
LGDGSWNLFRTFIFSYCKGVVLGGGIETYSRDLLPSSWVILVKLRPHHQPQYAVNIIMTVTMHERRESRDADLK